MLTNRTRYYDWITNSINAMTCIKQMLTIIIVTINKIVITGAF